MLIRSARRTVSLSTIWVAALVLAPFGYACDSSERTPTRGPSEAHLAAGLEQKGEQSENQEEPAIETQPEDDPEHTRSTDPEPIEAPYPDIHEVADGCKRFTSPVVEFLVDVEGNPIEIKYIRSTGCEQADEIIMAYLKRWLFEPGTQDGTPAEKEYVVSIHW